MRQEAEPVISCTVRKLVKKEIHLVCVFSTYIKRRPCYSSTKYAATVDFCVFYYYYYLSYNLYHCLLHQSILLLYYHYYKWFILAYLYYQRTFITRNNTQKNDPHNNPLILCNWCLLRSQNSRKFNLPTKKTKMYFVIIIVMVLLLIVA